MSELYALPEGWEWKKLGEVVSIIGGGTPSKKDPTYYENGFIKWASVRDMNTDTITDTEIKITQKAIEESTTNIIPKEAIIIATRVGLGKVCFLESDTAINQDLKGIVPNRLTTKEYLFFYFKSIVDFIVKNGTGATVKGVKLNFIKNLDIPLPPLQEQKCIVAKLDSLFERIDRAIALHQQNIDEAEGLMGSALDAVFGELEGEYNKVSLGDITKTTSGGTPKRSEKSYWDGGTIGWLKSGELNDDYIDHVEEFITEEGLKKSSAKVFPKGTLLIAMYGATVGKLAILNIETSTNQAICAILNDQQKFETKFMFYFLKKIREKMLKDSFGGAQPNISQTYIKELQLPLPPLHIQQKTVQYLDALSQKVAHLKQVQQEKMQQLKALKASILDRAFRGEI